MSAMSTAASTIPPRAKAKGKSTKFKGAPKKLCMSFGGCGFLGVYHVGVGKCVVDHAPHLFSEFETFYGASAGAITAVCAACQTDPMTAYKWVRKTLEDSKKYWFGMWNPFFDVYARLRTFLDGYLPDNAHMLCRNKVQISLTVLGENNLPSNWLVSDFNTRRELINIIVASSFIPGYAGFQDMPKIRGRRCCDGGFTSNIPRLSDPDVITVTPFAGFCDICPQGESYMDYVINICDQPMQLSAENIYRLTRALCPTSWKELEDLYHQGYSDCLSFLRNEGLVPDPVIHRREHSTLSTCSSLEDSSTTLSFATCTRPYDLPGSYSSLGHRRLSLSATGEYLSCLGSEISSVTSIPLEDIEIGLDLKGTEKATHLMRHYGREESSQDLTLWYLGEQPNGDSEDSDTESRGSGEGVEPQRRGVVSSLVRQPVKIVKFSWNGLSWCSSRIHEVLPRRLSQQWPLSKLASGQNLSSEVGEDPSSHEGFFGRFMSSSMFTF